MKVVIFLAISSFFILSCAFPLHMAAFQNRRLKLSSLCLDSAQITCYECCTLGPSSDLKPKNLGGISCCFLDNGNLSVHDVHVDPVNSRDIDQLVRNPPIRTAANMLFGCSWCIRQP